MAPKNAVHGNDALSKLRARAAKAPAEPGIYRWLDAEGTILYVGKAKDLRARLKSYFGKDPGGPWKQALMRQVADLDTTITGSELEALVLETNLIKEHRPKYNVLMKDDKNYVYARITVRERYPRISVVRRMEDDDAKYFGPFTSAYELTQLLDLLHLLFPWKACKASLDALNVKAGKAERTDLPALSHVPAVSALHACTAYHIGQCVGLCVGEMTEEQYRASIEELLRFFRGNRAPALLRLRDRMQAEATAKRFERAAELRNHLRLLEGEQELQRVSDPSQGDADIVGVALLSGRAQVVVLLQRDGKIIGERQFSLAGHAESIAEVLAQFLPQYAEAAADLPPLLLIPEDFEGRAAFADMLTGFGKRTEVRVPERGKKSALLELAMKNALAKARQSEAKWEADGRNTQNALAELSSTLGLQSPLKRIEGPALSRIEGYDISHLGGTETVGSMVVLRDGKPVSDQYRSFAIRTMKSGVVDDYRALKEVLTRRFRRLTEDLPAEEKRWKEEGIAFGKARKKEQKIVEDIHAAHPSEMSALRVEYRQYLVARYAGTIVGFGRLFRHSQGILELKSVWVSDAWRGQRLGQFIARKLLRGVKKGKVYVTIVPELEEYYGEIGFRYVLKSPRVLQEEMDEEKRKFPETPMGIAMLYEVQQHKVDPSFASTPDLLVIDGGKGQLSAAIEAMNALGISHWPTIPAAGSTCSPLRGKISLTIPVIGLAKREEEVFVPGKSDPIVFPNDAPAKFLLMRLRDEAHRFANKGREARGMKSAVQSSLSLIPGIGPETERALLKKFGSVESARKASDEELRHVLTAHQLESFRRFSAE